MITKKVELHDTINHPQHYADSEIEVIDYIEDKNFNFHLGNAIKYISRAGKKVDGCDNGIDKEIEDLQKAIWYLKRRIHKLNDKSSME